MYLFLNFDVSIICNLPEIMFVTITAGFSLVTYLSLTFKLFKQGIAINECYSYNRFQPNKLSISDF